jgi:hypothetical protein
MDIFAAAGAAPKAKVDAKGKKDERTSYQMGPNLDVIVALDYLEKMIKAEKESRLTEAKDEATEHFVEQAINNGSCESFIGKTDTTKAMFVIGKRASTSAPSVEQLSLFMEFGVPTTTVTKKPAVQEHFILNPAILGNARLMKKLSDAIVKAGLGTIPDEDGNQVSILQKVEAEDEISYVATSEETLPYIYKVAEQGVAAVNEEVRDDVAAKHAEKGKLPEEIISALLAAAATITVKACELTKGDATIEDVYAILKANKVNLTVANDDKKGSVAKATAPKKTAKK